jgi:CRP/FNR family cyclic AMP-dependent transcriptional regulator
MLMVTTVEALSQLPFFAGLGEDDLAKIAPYIHERTFSPGQMIISEGEPCQAVYFVVRGVVRVHRLSLEGREHVLAYLGPGEFFNVVPVLDGGPNPATVDALAEATLYTVSCQRFRRIVREYHEVALPILERLAVRVRHLGDMAEGLALHPVSTRLARFLLAQAEGQQPAHHWTQEEIAAHIGTVREVVGRTLRAFAAAGLIRRQRGRIVVVDRAGLEREAMMSG